VGSRQFLPPLLQFSDIWKHQDTDFPTDIRQFLLHAGLPGSVRLDKEVHAAPVFKSVHTKVNTLVYTRFEWDEAKERGDRTIRIISARNATARERQMYEKEIGH
jgi:hypothetical protein